MNCYHLIHYQKGHIMKKFLFLLLLIAIGWGYYEGSNESSTIQPQGHTATAAAVPKEDPSFLSQVTGAVSGTIRTVVSGVTGLASSDKDKGAAQTPPPAAPAASSKPVSDPASPIREQPVSEGIQDQFNDVYEFKNALESRINRDNFVPADKIPKQLKEAIVAAEDRRFYEHGAMDPIGVTRALIANYTAGRTVEGGSTLAQQTVKNIFLSQERTMTRKIREMFLAVQLERNYTKDQILEIYLNTIYFGHGTYGLKEAAKTYFGKAPEDLNLSECAMLAGLPQAPSAYDPIDHPEEGKKRMTTVLMLMAREGYITPQEASKAAFDVLLKK